MPDDDPLGGSSPYMPRSPDPTTATAAATAAAIDVSRRELNALRELHDKDLAALAATIDARLAGMDQDRGRLWERIRELPSQQETANDHFRDEVARRDTAGRELIEQRLTDLDKARALASSQMEKILEDARQAHARIPGDLPRQIAAEREYILAQIEIVRAIMAEKFTAVDGRFEESKEAVAAALASAKEAVSAQNQSNSAAIGVSETNTKEQLKSLSEVTRAENNALSGKIDDARTRLTTLESRTAGIQQGTSSLREARSEQLAERGFTHNAMVTVFIGLSLLVSIGSILLAAFGK